MSTAAQLPRRGELGFRYGGMIPKGSLAEDGIMPEEFDQLEVALYVNTTVA